jgi:2-desacetyl-2-hydroxyethyl bacteriochlorophyllide A dehydrogenase
MTTRSVIQFVGERKLEVIQEPIHDPGPGELLIRTHCTLVSTGTESTVYTRNFAPNTHWDKWVKYPFRPGYLHSGEVLAVGPEVEGWRVGDRIASRSGHASHVHLRVAAPKGSNPEQGDCTPVSQGIRIPEGVSHEAACWMGLGKITQLGIRAAAPEMGDDVVVVGLGVLGQLVAQYSLLMGARRVIAIDTSALRIGMAAHFGATHCLKQTATDAHDEAMSLTDGRGADIVYDVTGHPAAFAASLPLVRKFGKMVLVGDPGNPSAQTLTPDVITRGIRIVGVHDMHAPTTANHPGDWTDERIYRLFLHYLSTGQMRTEQLITHRFQPSDAADAYEYLQTNRHEVMGVMFDWRNA